MSAPQYTVSEVDSERDFPELIACEWSAFEHAKIHFFRLWCPIHGSGPDAYADSLAECTTRQREWHLKNPNSYWMKATDVNGKIVGGALWKYYEHDPTENDDYSSAYWYPEGGARDFVTKTMDLYDAPRRRMGKRPHWFLFILFVDPAHQREGVATRLLRWGLDRTDESQVESWLNASKYGKALYERHGYTMVDSEPFAPETANPDEGWKRMAGELPQLGTGAMWRPIGGKQAGGDTKPWSAAEGER